jgi:hypothetical protein
MATSPHQRLEGATKLRMIERDTHIDTEICLPVSGKEQVEIDQKNPSPFPGYLFNILIYLQSFVSFLRRKLHLLSSNA